MKTTKLILVAALMAFAAIGFSQSELPTKSNQTKSEPQLSLVIGFNNAMHNARLVQAMYAQLDPSFLLNDQRVYIVPVRFSHTVLYVSGTYEQWKRFFQSKPVPISPPEE